jgi:hypothetical protein
MAHSAVGIAGVPLAVDAHAHLFDLERYPFHPSSGFDLLPNQAGTARQYAAVLDVHGISHALLINPLGGYGLDNRNMLDVIGAGAGRPAALVSGRCGSPQGTVGQPFALVRLPRVRFVRHATMTQSIHQELK